MKKILVIDIGDVFFRTFPDRQYKKLSVLLDISWTIVKSRIEESDIIGEFETGLINQEEFIEGIKSLFDKRISDNEVIKSWNAVLGGMNARLANELSRIIRDGSVDIYIASSINELHWENVSRMIEEKLQLSGKLLSFEVGCSKKSIQYVDALRGLIPSGHSVLVVDDDQGFLDLVSARTGFETLLFSSETKATDQIRTWVDKS